MKLEYQGFECVESSSNEALRRYDALKNQVNELSSLAKTKDIRRGEARRRRTTDASPWYYVRSFRRRLLRRRPEDRMCCAAYRSRRKANDIAKYGEAPVYDMLAGV
ncbi:hypothetical protein PG995_010619 [Apiospora arundinis]